MKRQHLMHIILASFMTFLIGISSCSDNVWDEMPKSISSFIAQYFPGIGISSFTESKTGYHVDIRNDASLDFDLNCDWTKINGNGSPLPSDLVLDQLPAPLYEYLEATEQAGSVFAVKRDKDSYRLTLHNSEIDYDIKTRTVTYLKND